MEFEDRIAKRGSPRRPRGIKLVQKLKGHSDWIGRIAWSPVTSMLASVSGDQTIRLWDAEMGKVERTLVGHRAAVVSAAFDSTGSVLASGSWDRTARLWDTSTGRLTRILSGHEGSVYAIASHPNQPVFATGGTDRTIRVWDINGDRSRVLQTKATEINSLAFNSKGDILAAACDDTIELWGLNDGTLIRILEGHRDRVRTVQYANRDELIVSGGRDSTVRLWDTVQGRLYHTLEGHSGEVSCIALADDDRIIISLGDSSVRIWNLQSGACLATSTFRNGGFYWAKGVAAHPRLPFVAAVSRDPETADETEVILIWTLDFDELRRAGSRTVTYTSAKIVLVGESNVGKSYLAHRLATGEPPTQGTIQSTHGMKFWPIEPERLSPALAPAPGQRRDIVLWDIGGQDEYRLVHQLFLHDTTLALVLLDPTRGRTAFEEVEAWNKRLEKQLRGRPAVKFLVGTKLDQASGMIDNHGLRRVVSECAFAGYHETSALTGRGISELSGAIAGAIDWDGLGKTSRPALFQRILDKIEAQRRLGSVVLSILDLHKLIGRKPPSDEQADAVIAVADQIASQGIIARSRVSTGEHMLVL
jgi:small GTP-binding protein